MEIEYKWDMPDEGLAEKLLASEMLAGAHPERHSISMHAIYFDTVQGDVAAMRGGLRIREEDGRSVCCLKLAAQSNDTCKTRREYEVDAHDIVEGLKKLPGAGAPSDICERLLAGELAEICETEFVRQAYRLALKDCSAELAIDLGELRRNGKSAPISEIEFEYISGSEDAFHMAAMRLQTEFSLAVQPLSKLARAMAL